MKKILALLTIAALSNHIQTNELINLWYDFDHEIDSPLSKTQQLQLTYLQDELKKLGDSLQTWAQNKQVLNLLEIMELSVFQSSLKTRDIFEQQIIKIFKQYNIDIYFDQNGLIEKMDTESEPIPHLKKSTKKLKFHHTNNTVVKKYIPQKIKGANRTRKKLEKAWKERKEAAKRATQKKSQDNSIKKSKQPTPADLMAEKIWDTQMEKYRTKIDPEENESPETTMNFSEISSS